MKEAEKKRGLKKLRADAPRRLMPRVPAPVLLMMMMVVAFGGVLAVQALRGDGWGVEGIASGPQTAAVGSQAPGFTLRDVQGKSYVVRPGDGKAHLLVFYMGYF